jgi:hypothetical protein
MHKFLGLGFAKWIYYFMLNEACYWACNLAFYIIVVSKIHN